MTKAEFIAAFAALAQETRLDIFRMLLQRDPDGIPPGEIGERLKLPAPTLSFHLNHLKHSGLVGSRRESRAVFYSVRMGVIDKVVDYLVENCGARVKPASADLRTKTKSSGPRKRILFLCTRNSARSIMAECAMQRCGGERFRAFSAGSNPADRVHPATLRLLNELGYETIHSAGGALRDPPLSAGLLPALNAGIFRRHIAPSHITAIMLRAELRVHRKRILFRGPEDFVLVRRSAQGPV